MSNQQGGHVPAGNDLINLDKIIGRVISSALLVNEEKLVLTFADGTRLTLRDDGQSCCENRYITSDDDLSVLVGGVLHSINAKPAANITMQDEHGEHEIMFVTVQGSGGFVTLTTHNQHNGYYGGFTLRVDVHTPAELAQQEIDKKRRAESARRELNQTKPDLEAWQKWADVGGGPGFGKSAIVEAFINAQPSRNRAERRAGKPARVTPLSNFKFPGGSK